MREVVVLALLYSTFIICAQCFTVMSDYWTKRRKIIDDERSMSMGGKILLSSKEKSVNRQLLKLKQSELDSIDCPAFDLFINRSEDVKNSKVYKFIKNLPKGGSLHTHLFASVSVDFVESLLERDNLYLCNDERLKLKFLNDVSSETCQLVSLKLQDDSFRRWLLSQLTINPEDTKKGLIEVWTKFKQSFTLTYDLFTYSGVFEEYVHQMLTEHYKDNVIYIEIKAPFVELYDLDGTVYDEEHFIKTLWKINKQFKKHNSRFMGMKYIYSPYRRIDSNTLNSNLIALKKLMEKYPDFIVGIDLVGYEGDSPIKEHVDDLLKINDLNIYLHAGETNDYGGGVDENLIDAVLLNSKRIGHAYSLIKHPELIKIIKERNIGIELCPLSNQALKLVNDLRNHPASFFVANNLDVIICNDDPGNWGAQGLSFDWYYAFMAMTHRDAGLEFLKKAALNSIEHSGMNSMEKAEAFIVWKQQWDDFIDKLWNE